MTEVAIVIVTYNSAAVIADCLASLPAAAEVIIVDNASSDETATIVRRAAPGAHWLPLSRNIGFGPAMNKGFAATNRPFILILNPDAVLMPDSLSRLLATAQANPQAALIGPAILDPQGRQILSHDVDLLQRRLWPRKRQGEPLPEGVFCTWFLSGAVLLARRRALQHVGGFDTAIFLYFEDDDLCRRLIDAGYCLLQAPAAKVQHIGGGSVKPGWRMRWRQFFHLSYSRLYFSHKHAGRAAVWRLGGPMIPRFAAKSLFNLLIGRWRRSWRDAARFCGTLSYMFTSLRAGHRFD